MSRHAVSFYAPDSSRPACWRARRRSRTCETPAARAGADRRASARSALVRAEADLTTPHRQAQRAPRGRRTAQCAAHTSCRSKRCGSTQLAERVKQRSGQIDGELGRDRRAGTRALQRNAGEREARFEELDHAAGERARSARPSSTTRDRSGAMRAARGARGQQRACRASARRRSAACRRASTRAKHRPRDRSVAPCRRRAARRRRRHGAARTGSARRLRRAQAGLQDCAGAEARARRSAARRSAAATTSFAQQLRALDEAAPAARARARSRCASGSPSCS